jgi:hypothetical protein
LFGGAFIINVAICARKDTGCAELFEAGVELFAGGAELSVICVA